MTIFDQLTFEQRSLAIQSLAVLLEALKETHLRDELVERGLVVTFGGAKLQDIEQQILEFSLNNFGQPYSHEAGEDHE